MNIDIIGAKTHNLKNLDVSIPRDKLVVITGVSGSGKSTLAFDVIFSEAQREYLETLGSYARINLPKIGPADVEIIRGLSPATVIDQRPLGRNPRSTIGTVTDVYTFLRLLFSRMGTPKGLAAADFSFNNPSGACPTCKGLGVELKIDLDKLIDWNKSLAEGAIRHRRWAVDSRYWNIIKATNHFDMNKALRGFDQDELSYLLYAPAQNYQNKEPGYIQNFTFEGIINRLVKRQGDSRGQSGAAYDQEFFSLNTCSDCQGARLNSLARSVLVNGVSLVEIVSAEISELRPFFDTLEGPVAGSIVSYIKKILDNLIEIGIGYLTLSRSVSTLSNGESQRVKLARQLGSSLTELICILDEPTTGLHARDVAHLSSVLRGLTAKPNTVIVVEHDKTIMLNADHIVDMGPGAGTKGGQIIAQGTPEDIKQSNSLTGQYLSGKLKIERQRIPRPTTSYLEVESATLHNLKSINVRIPRNAFTCITGVSGSGKSSLVDVLISRHPGIVVVDQTPPGTSVVSNPATYTKVFDDIRRVFARATGQSVSIFTFNGEGACEHCNGNGVVTTDMHFLGDISQICEECRGTRYKPYVLDYKYKGFSIADILDMTVVQANNLFEVKTINKTLELLVELGLDYLKLGQTLSSLSGGEAQRIKMVSRLGRSGETYVLDEPSRGLHFADIDRLLNLIDRLVSDRNTVIVVEHNLDIIKNADWIIDMGPEGGDLGGYVLIEGTPDAVANCQNSHTGRYLAAMQLSESQNLDKVDI